MSVKVKDVGNYKIHVKETTTDAPYTSWLWGLWCIIGLALMWISSIFVSKQDVVSTILSFITIFTGSCIAIYGLYISNNNLFQVPAYYIDTTMYGVGGKTIRKTTPAQDHIAICQAAQEFEKEILGRIKKEKELEEIVGKCK